MADLKKPPASSMCQVGFHVVQGHERHCASGTVSWVDAHVRRNPKKSSAGYLPENLLYLYWNNTKKFKKLPDIPKFKGRDEYDDAIQFWIDYWKQQGLPFPDDLDPLMIKAMIAIESDFNANAKNPTSSAGGLLQVTNTAMRTLHGIPDKNGWVDVKKEKVHVLPREKMDPIINIALAVRILSYKYTKIPKYFTKDAVGMIAGYNQFKPAGITYAIKVLALFKEAQKK